MNNVPDSQPSSVAPLWRRGAARFIDLLSLGVLVALFLYVAHKLGIERFPINDGIVFLVIVSYELVVPLLSRGQGLGRAIVGIQLQRESASLPPSFLQYLARMCARIAIFATFAVLVAYDMDMNAFFAVVIIEAVVCALNRRRQTVGDLVARTVVVMRGHVR